MITVHSIEWFYDLMIAEKNTMANLNTLQPNIDSSQTLLNDLKSTSKVSRWRLVFWCVACALYALNVLMALAILMMEAIAAKSRYGTLAWYASIAKEFQYGDALVFQDLEWKYATINEANKIVMLSAAQEGGGKVNIKIATIIGGVTQKLTGPQLAGFVGYIKKRKPAGPNVHIINDDPDDLALGLIVNYDPLVLTNAGELIATPGSFPVNDAIDQYLKALDFNGGFELMKLIDNVQAAKGVDTAYISSASARYGANPFVPFTQRYFPNAGYLVIHSSSVTTYNVV